MNKIIKKWQDTNMTYRMLALIFSIVLFLNTNNNSFQSSFYSTSESYNETVQNVLVNLTYDKDEYYVHGYEPTVAVNLFSINRIQLDSEVNEDTRSFRVVADLSNLGEGTHEVKLRAQNLSSAVSAEVQPRTITVTIEKKVTKKMEVEPILSSSDLASGYELEDLSASPASVKITTGEDTLAQIDRVVAVVNLSQTTSESFSESVNVEALDASGQPLSIIAEPGQVNVSVKLKAPEKEVSLRTTQHGAASAGIASFEVTLSQDTAVITGPQTTLDSFENLTIPIDVSGITSNTTRTVEIPQDGYSVKPRTVQATIRPVFNQDSSSGSRSQNSNDQNQGGNNGAGGNNNTPPDSSDTSSSSSSTDSTVTSSDNQEADN